MNIFAKLFGTKVKEVNPLKDELDERINQMFESYLQEHISYKDYKDFVKTETAAYKQKLKEVA